MTSSSVNEKRFILACFFTNAIISAVSPYIPIMVRDIGYSTIMVGILLGIFEGAGIAGPIILGNLADKTGKYRMLLIVTCMVTGLAAFPVAWFVSPLASALLLSLMAFCFKAVTSLFDAATTIQIGPTGNYGRIRVWGSVGFVAAVLFLQWTPFYKPVNSHNIAFWILVISFLSIIPLIVMPKPARKTENTANKTGKQRSGKIITGYFVVGFMLIFISRFSMSSFYTFYPLYMTEVLGWNAIGLLYALSAGSEIPFIFFSDRIIRRFGPLPLLAVSTLAVCARLLLLAVFISKPLIIAAQLLHALCYGIFHPAAIRFISEVFPPEKRGLGMSVYLALGAGLPVLIGNMAGGVIVEAVGHRSLLAIYAAVSGVAVMVYVILRKNSNLSQRKG